MKRERERERERERTINRNVWAMATRQENVWNTFFQNYSYGVAKGNANKKAKGPFPTRENVKPIWRLKNYFLSNFLLVAAMREFSSTKKSFTQIRSCVTLTSLTKSLLSMKLGLLMSH